MSDKEWKYFADLEDRVAIISKRLIEMENKLSLLNNRLDNLITLVRDEK